MLEGASEDDESEFGCGICDMERSQCGAEACRGCRKKDTETLDTSNNGRSLRVVACSFLGAKENGGCVHQSPPPHDAEKIGGGIRYMEGAQLNAEEDGDCVWQDHCEDAECEARHGVCDLVGPC